MRSKPVVGLSKLRYDDESYTEVELQSLTNGSSHSGVITWLSSENSVISHHRLENARMTLRGGADEAALPDIASPESFDKKKSTSSTGLV